MQWLTRSISLALFLLLSVLFIHSTSAQSVAAQPTSGDILLTGRVTDEGTGAPLANVYVSFCRPPGSIDCPLVATTNSSGTYTVTQPVENCWWILFTPGDSE